MDKDTAKQPTPASPSQGRIFAIVMTVIAVAMLVGLCVLSVNASRQLAGTYHVFAEADLSQDFSGEIIYDDHAGLQAHHGASLVGGEEGNDAFRDEWLAESLGSIDRMIVFTCTFYALFINLLLAYPLWRRFGRRKGVHVAAIALSVLGAFASSLGSILITHAACALPFYFPTGRPLLTLAVGLLSGIGGLCAVGLLLRLIRWKRIAAVLVIPLVFIIAIPQLEEGLFTTPTMESFDSAHTYYESLGGEDFDGPLYYDEERGVLVVGDREFEPEIVPNPDCLVGAPRVLGIVAEAANPFSGNALTMIADAVPEVPLWALALYALKALAWIVLPAILTRRKKAPALAA